MFIPPSDSKADAGYVSAADEPAAPPSVAASPSTSADHGNKPFSVSPATGFPSGGTKKGTGVADSGTHCSVSPDGRSKTWTTIGQDQARKDHPFMRKVVEHTSSTGFTVVDKTETHWTIATSKDGKSRGVHYQTTMDEAVYDASGHEYAHHKRSYNGSFDTDKPLPFESEAPSASLNGASLSSDDEAAKRRDAERDAARKAHIAKPQ